MWMSVPRVFISVMSLQDAITLLEHMPASVQWDTAKMNWVNVLVSRKKKLENNVKSRYWWVCRITWKLLQRKRNLCEQGGFLRMSMQARILWRRIQMYARWEEILYRGGTGQGWMWPTPCLRSGWSRTCGLQHVQNGIQNGRWKVHWFEILFTHWPNLPDINECSESGLNMCSPSANCNNLLGTYACSCKEGFKGDGYMCEGTLFTFTRIIKNIDIDECTANPCHPQAECENLLGSFKCSCPSGFTGDGIKECMNPLERSCENVAGFCGRVEHTACLSVRIFNGSLSSVCECEPGFRFNKELNKCEGW